ncbi:Delta-1-pyrroline-5-carboxylate synthase [Asimina triloba]
MDPSRAFVKEVKRVVVKVGTAVVTRADGRLALGRLGALCEQLKELNSRGFDIILVTSGAVGVGRQRLKYRRLVHSSFADLQKPQVELDGKACAAVGQSGLMALYDVLFSQLLSVLAGLFVVYMQSLDDIIILDVTSSQLLVTDRDFMDPDFRTQLRETVNSLLDLRHDDTTRDVILWDRAHLGRVWGYKQRDLNKLSNNINNKYEEKKRSGGEIPISCRRITVDSSGIFWDNDSLAALLALELKADLLVLLSDVEGLFSGPPGEPNSKLIDTYIQEKHQREITFGDKSRVGRGGMTAKVKAAVYAACAGTPVVITSGFATDNIIKVLEGERVGTLFHQHATMGSPRKQVGPREMAVAARECSRRLQALSSQDRRKILQDIADALEANENLIKVENDADVAAAQLAGYDKSLISRLTLKPGKARDDSMTQISSLSKSIRVLADMEDPIGFVLKRTELADGLILEKTSCPLGVLLIVFESRPDALVQIASLAVRSGNGLLLKGGKEAMRSNAILHKVITEAIPDRVGKSIVGLVTSRDEIPDLLMLDDVIDLVIPRGSNKLVSQIKESTKIPVLGHADGICHVYVDKSASMDKAKRIVLDAKIDYPAACNAMETLLVHEHLLKNGGLNELVLELKNEGVTLYGGPRAAAALDIPETHAHTDCIVAEDPEVTEVFLCQVDRSFQPRILQDTHKEWTLPKLDYIIRMFDNLTIIVRQRNECFASRLLEILEGLYPKFSFVSEHVAMFAVLAVLLYFTMQVHVSAMEPVLDLAQRINSKVLRTPPCGFTILS